MQAIIEEAVKFAFKDRNWIIKILIGGVLGLIPIVNAVFIIGYSLSVLKDSLDNKPAVLPEWSGWKEIAKNGLYGFAALVLYGIPMIFLGLMAGPSGLGKIFYVLFLMTNFFTIPLFTLALVQWYRTGNFKGIFDFSAVWQNFSRASQQYILATLALVALPFILSVLMRLLGLEIFRMSGVGPFFPGAFLQLVLTALWFWLSVVGFRVFGQIAITTQK